MIRHLNRFVQTNTHTRTRTVVKLQRITCTHTHIQAHAQTHICVKKRFAAISDRCRNHLAYCKDSSKSQRIVEDIIVQTFHNIHGHIFKILVSFPNTSIIAINSNQVQFSCFSYKRSYWKQSVFNSSHSWRAYPIRLVVTCNFLLTMTDRWQQQCNSQKL